MIKFKDSTYGKENLEDDTFEAAEARKKKREEEVDLGIKADANFASILLLFDAKDYSKAQQILTVFRTRLKLGAIETMTPAELKTNLYEAKQKYTEDFNKACEDRVLESKAILNSLMYYNIVDKTGNSYFLKGEPIPLANSEKEMISYLLDKTKEKEINLLLAERDAVIKTHKTK
jgi:hypothetical protein